METNTIRVKSKTDVLRLAASLDHAYTKSPDVPIELHAVGAGALNQAIKGVIILNTRLSNRLKTAVIRPAFSKFHDENVSADKEFTAIRLCVEIKDVYRE